MESILTFIFNISWIKLISFNFISSTTLSNYLSKLFLSLASVSFFFKLSVLVPQNFILGLLHVHLFRIIYLELFILATFSNIKWDGMWPDSFKLPISSLSKEILLKQCIYFSSQSGTKLPLCTCQVIKTFRRTSQLCWCKQLECQEEESNYYKKT